MKKLLLAVMILTLVAGVGFAKSLTDYDRNLIDLLKDGNIGIRASAAQLLGERKVEQAVKPLIKMLQTEKNFKARIVAAIALQKIGSSEALPVLKNISLKDENRTVRRVVTGLVVEFTNTDSTKM